MMVMRLMRQIPLLKFNSQGLYQVLQRAKRHKKLAECLLFYELAALSFYYHCYVQIQMFVKYKIKPN